MRKILNCTICGKEIEKSSYSNEVLCSSECFRIDFWNEKVEDVNNELEEHKFAIIDGTVYYIGNENDSKFFRGFGGRKFIIEFNDGTEITTTNLWCNGDVPEDYKGKLPNNAKFK